MSKQDEYLGKRYRKDGGGYWAVVGYIDNPAVVLRDPLTGEARVVVIGSGQYRDMNEIPDDEALRIAEQMMFNK